MSNESKKQDKPKLPVVDEVRNWLNDKGYPLEMQTAQIFRLAGFATTQSAYYRDKETDKLREIDVLATVEKDFGNRRCKLEFVVECKGHPNPWVAFTGDAPRQPDDVCNCVSSLYGARILNGVYQLPAVKALPAFRLALVMALWMVKLCVNVIDFFK